MKQPQHEVMEFPKHANRHGVWQAWGILLLGLIATTLVAHYTKSAVDAVEKQEFNFVCNEIRGRIQDRLTAYEQILRSGAAFFADEDGVTRAEWRLFAERQKINQHLPGIQGIGFARLIPRQHLAQHLLAVRAEGFPAYQVRPEGERETYSSIVYLEPFADRNLRAFGYDMLSEPVRRAAMERARDQDEAALSGRVVLVQETGQDVQAGTLMYVPVYRVGMPSETVEQRRAALLGWVYSPYRMKDLMQGILGGWDLAFEKRIHLEIFDSDKVSPENLLFDSQSGESQPKGGASGLSLQSGVISAGRPWSLSFTRTGGRASEVDYGKVWLVMLGGISTSILLSGLFFSMLNTRFKAWQMASRLTTELRQSEEKYSIIFKNEIYAICIFDLETLRLLDVNEAYSRVYGYSREELLSGLTIHDITAEQQSSESATRKADREGTIFIPLRYHRRKDGTVFPVEIVGGPYVWQGKRVMFALAHDISDRQQMELALRKSKQQFDGLAANIPVGVYLLRTTPARGFSFEYVSPRMAEMLNVAAAAILADPQVAFQPIHPEDLAGFIQLNRERTETQRLFWWEGRALIRGAVRWLRIESQPEPLENGDVLWHGIIVDITEGKRVDAELEDNRVRLALAMDQAHLAYWEMDAATATFTFNDRFYALYGTTAEREGSYRMTAEVYAREFLPPEEQHILAPDVARLLAGEIDEVQAEHRIRRRDGELRHILVRITTVRDAAGRVVGTRGTNQDITERRRAENSLRASEENFRQLAENISDVFWITSPDFSTVHYVSAAYERIWGQSTTSLHAQPHRWLEAILPEERERVMAAFAKLAGNETAASVEYRITRPDGSIRWISDRAFGVRDAAGNVIRLTRIACDITDRIRQQQEVHELHAQTEQDARTKGELLKEVNHRVTNNLTAVLGLLVHEKESVGGSERSLVAPVLDRLQQRIRGLLQVHRMLAQSAWAPVRLDKLAQEIIWAALSAAPWRHQAVVTIKPSALKVSPRQAGGLALVLNELTTNTVKYGGRPSHAVAISLEAESHEEWTTICYRDNGLGYPADVVAGQRANVGLKLINEIVTKTLRGSLDLTNDQGAVAVIRIQLEDENRT